MNATHTPGFDCVVVGGGIVGLATAWEVIKSSPGARVAVLEKEPAFALHQSGRNSGVIHSGIYYPPGSLKARLARAGNLALRRFCERHGIEHEICGKLIVATEARELPLLDALQRRAGQNGIEVQPLSSDEAREIEPHVRCHAALRVPDTGIVNYRAVAGKLAALVEELGGELWLATTVRGLREYAGEQIVETSRGEMRTRFLINCAGLHSDRLAALSGNNPGVRIVPFRGEYYELAPSRRHFVRNLIYPVPNPAFPFLGVHLTRMIDGSVHAGPNAVLALHREAYTWASLPIRQLRDVAETFAFPGFWRLAAKHWDEGCRELVRSLSKRAFVRALQKLVPAITEDDVIPSTAGVRAQALRSDGSLVDDFLIVPGRRSLHVCNAPSPAATAALEIARAIVRHMPAPERTVVAA